MNKNKPESKPVDAKSKNFSIKNNNNSNNENNPIFNTKNNSSKEPNNSITLQDGIKSSKMSTSNLVSIKAANQSTE